MILICLPPVKSGVVAVYTLHLVAASQNNTVWPLLERKKPHFHVPDRNKIVCKVVDNEKMHNSAVYGFMIQKFTVSSSPDMPKKHPFWAIWPLIQCQAWFTKFLGMQRCTPMHNMGSIFESLLWILHLPSHLRHKRSEERRVGKECLL